MQRLCTVPSFWKYVCAATKHRNKCIATPLVCTKMTRNGWRQEGSVVLGFLYFTDQKQGDNSCIVLACTSTAPDMAVVRAQEHDHPFFRMDHLNSDFRSMLTSFISRTLIISQISSKSIFSSIVYDTGESIYWLRIEGRQLHPGWYSFRNLRT